MKKIFTKITAFVLIAIFICACNAVKRVPDGKLLLTKNEISVNNKSIKDEVVFNQLYQKPNSTLLGYRLRLNLYNLANLNPDSTYQAKFIKHPGKYERQAKWLSAKQVDRLGQSFFYHGIHDFLKRTGEPPVIIDKSKSDKSLLRLKYYYFNNGYFNVKTNYTIDTLKNKKAKIKYAITTGEPFTLDTLKTTISTHALDSLYKVNKSPTFLKSGNQYKTEDFENEKNRITTHFRNHGVYNFQPNYVTFDIDTIKKVNQANVNLIINNYSYQDKDSTKTEPFKIYKISDVNIYTNYSSSKNYKITDTTTYNNFNLYSQGKLKYKPSAITNAIFINKGHLFTDNRTVLTTRYLNNLKIFNYPSVQYEIDKRDTTSHSLIAKIYLTPRKKFSFGTTLDLTHSNIQDIGIGLSVSETIRNVFNGAETLEIAARGNIGSSKDLANPNNTFFNVSEYGLDLKLNFPRIVMPFETEKIIPKSMIPSTLITAGFAKQTNIGLDKENFTGALSYNWTPKRNNTARFDLFNAQYVRNLNPQNYFNVYKSSYNALNELAQNPNYSIDVDPSYLNNNNLIVDYGTNGFINDILGSNPRIHPNETDYEKIKSIEERRIRLSENDFILASSYTFTKTTKRDLADNNFYLFKTKIESAGSFLSMVSNTLNLPKNANGNHEIFNLEYSEYIKTEFDYIKHWDLTKEKVLAVRTFFGIAIPFGNSNNVPFSRSYFSGGSNDNRGWQPYSLGPGSSGAKNDFNEANMKIAISSEFRFKILGSLKGALFADAGNIWNVLDNVVDKKSTFTGFKDLKDIALGSGFGLRYDFSFFVIRFDLGFKTYNPANENNKRWFQEYNFGHSVLNFGINYPF